MMNYLIFGITYAFACVVQPGPFQAFLFSQSINNGWRKTIPLVFAPLLSDMPVIILVLFVLTHVPQEVLVFLQIAGGFFLFYLAYKACQTWRYFIPAEKQDIVPQHSVFKAVLVNLLNPNPYLGWSMVMGPTVLKGWNEAPVNALVLLVGFYSSMILYSIGLVGLFASARHLGAGISRIAIGISVIAFAGFGLYQLWSGITYFV